jgi:hypothetical protein
MFGEGVKFQACQISGFYPKSQDFKLFLRISGFTVEISGFVEKLQKRLIKPNRGISSCYLPLALSKIEEHF